MFWPFGVGIPAACSLDCWPSVGGMAWPGDVVAPVAPDVPPTVVELERVPALQTFAARGPYDVVDAASAEGLAFGLARRLLARARGAALVARSHGLEHLNYQRMIADHEAGVRPKPAWRRLWYPAVRAMRFTT